MTLFNGSPEAGRMKAKQYLLAIAQESFLDRKSRIMSFDSPDTAGGVLAHVMARDGYGETLHILRSAGFELHDRVLREMTNPGDIWLCVLYPYLVNAFHHGTWSKTASALRANKRVREAKPMIYFGCKDTLTPEGHKKHGFEYEDAKAVPASLYYLAETTVEIG